MAGEVFIDALPYYDQGYDEPGIKEAAYALIEEETRRYRPTKNYLELLTPIDELPFETEILRREFERMSSRLPMESLSMKRYELPPPPIGRQNDLSAWTECVENSMAQLEHQSERIANLELVSKYGGLSWRLHNDLLTKMLDGAQKELQAIRKEIQEINWNRKKDQTEAGTTLKTLQESWVKLVTKNYEIERACQDLELDLEKMKQKQEDIRQQKKKKQRRRGGEREEGRSTDRGDGRKADRDEERKADREREKGRIAERERVEGRRLERVERDREAERKTDRERDDDTERGDGEGRRTSVGERDQAAETKDDREEDGERHDEETLEGKRTSEKESEGKEGEKEDEVIEVDDEDGSSSSSGDEESPPRRKRDRSPSRKDRDESPPRETDKGGDESPPRKKDKDRDESPPRKKDKDGKGKEEEIKELKRVEFRAEDYPEELL